MLKIGELAQRTGLNPSKIRFFEKEGVFSAGQRQANGYRAYPETAVEQLNQLIQAQEIGFTLKELRAIHQSPEGAESDRLDIVEKAVIEKLANIKQLQEKLALNQHKLEAVLAALQNQPADSECISNAKRLLKS